MEHKTLRYAAAGVKEMLIIDILSDARGPWKLLGYRLEEKSYYQSIEPDPEGGLIFETIGLRFVAVERARIDVYDAETGQQLLRPDVLKDYTEAKAAARAKAEAHVAELEARLQELEARSEE